LVPLCVIAQIPRHDHRFGNSRLDKAPMTSLPSMVHEASLFKISDQLPHLRRAARAATRRLLQAVSLTRGPSRRRSGIQTASALRTAVSAFGTKPFGGMNESSAARPSDPPAISAIAASKILVTMARPRKSNFELSILSISTNPATRAVPRGIHRNSPHIQGTVTIPSCKFEPC
jgi:hypothetical protein